MPIIKDFKSTTIWRAFFLSSFRTTLIIFIATMVEDYYDRERNISHKTNYKKIYMTLLFTFLTAYISFIIMYFVFGYGDGMLA